MIWSMLVKEYEVPSCAATHGTSCSTDTASSPPQLVTVPPTVAPSKKASRCSAMSSSWIGQPTNSQSGLIGTGSPCATRVMILTGIPPKLARPYDQFIRATVSGTPWMRDSDLATASPANLLVPYAKRVLMRVLPPQRSVSL